METLNNNQCILFIYSVGINLSVNLEGRKLSGTYFPCRGYSWLTSDRVRIEVLLRSEARAKRRAPGRAFPVTEERSEEGEILATQVIFYRNLRIL